MRRWLVLVVPSLLLLAVSCSSSGDTPERAQTVEQTTSSATESTTTTEAALDPATITEEQLQGTLLTLEDMPTGYSPLPEDDGEPSDLFCDGRDPGDEVDEHVSADAPLFALNATTGPIITSIAGAYPSDEQASEFIAAFLNAAQQCPGPFPTPGDENGGTTTIAPLSFGNYGDEAAAIRITLEGGLLPATIDLVDVRVGPIVYVVGEITTVGGADIPQFEALIQTQLERTTALLDG